MTRIYLDNAATSWPKPIPVYGAVERYMRSNGASSGRSAYRESNEAERVVNETRFQLSQLIGCKDSQQIVFAFNGTDALNIAIHGILSPGDHVITSVIEHNSVLRPLRELEDSHQIKVTRIPCNTFGVVEPSDIKASIESATKLIILSHASNVTGAIQPVKEVAEIARDAGILFLVDAAQSLGQIPIDVQELQVDLLAAPGHKGLLGPLGTGFLYLAPGVEKLVKSFRQGGTGTQSEQDRQPEEMPEKFESGNHNVPGIVGLSEGIKYLESQGVDKIRQHHCQLTGRFLEKIENIDGVVFIGPRNEQLRVAVISLNVEGFSPQEAATMLEVSYGIQIRAGLHCAPLMHKALGTDANGGTIRFSLSPFTTVSEMDVSSQALAEIARAAGY